MVKWNYISYISPTTKANLAAGVPTAVYPMASGLHSRVATLTMLKFCKPATTMKGNDYASNFGMGNAQVFL